MSLKPNHLPRSHSIKSILPNTYWIPSSFLKSYLILWSAFLIDGLVNVL
jgi:hypothetical protein